VIANPSDGVEYSIVNRILVDANGSFDPDGDEISYEWYLNDQVEPIALGMNAWLDLTQGRYRLTLSVEDNSGASADSSVTFQVTDELDPISENQVSEEIWILLFIIIIIIIVLVSLFNLRTKKKNELR
ncbi:MAG: PKD domain-containing protein, partial [Candidatus Kariarchaeaceae archaeon]